MKELGITKGKELQVYFNNRVNDMLKKLGKTSIEWNDGIGDNTDSDVVGHYWILRTPSWIKEENDKRKFIVSTCPSLYFDYSHAVVPLKKVYNLFEANNKKRNMLVAANDFAYIFNRNDFKWSEEFYKIIKKLIYKYFLSKKQLNA